MRYPDGNKSEWTNHIVLILRRLDHEGYHPIPDDIKDNIMGNISNQEYNKKIASKIKYEVLSGASKIFMNHSCFIEDIHWNVVYTHRGLKYV